MINGMMMRSWTGRGDEAKTKIVPVNRFVLLYVNLLIFATFYLFFTHTYITQRTLIEDDVSNAPLYVHVYSKKDWGKESCVEFHYKLLLNVSFKG